MRHMLILADDLSGAADCGIACTNAGLNTIVALGELSKDVVADAVSIDADTRRLSAAAASARMDYLVRTYAADPATLLFKKIDSTLRGHLGPELAAVLRARRTGGKRAVAVMAPAFPAVGRTTVRGLHYVHGRPLHETEIWRSPMMTGEAYISHMLEGAGLVSANIDLAVVRSSGFKLHQALAEVAKTTDVLVCDAETDADLLSIAKASVTLGPEIFWVGSAGLAHHLPGAAGIASTSSKRNVQPTPPAGPTLFVIGSTSCTSKQQVAVLASSSSIHCITVPPDVLLAGSMGSVWHPFESELRHAIDRGRDVILAPGSKPEIELTHRPRLSMALAEMAAPLRDHVGALVASGGETARMVLERWGITTLRLFGELERGVPISVAETAGVSPFTVITKAGDFGDPETLLHCRESLHTIRGTYL